MSSLTEGVEDDTAAVTPAADEFMKELLLAVAPSDTSVFLKASTSTCTFGDDAFEVFVHSPLLCNERSSANTSTTVSLAIVAKLMVGTDGTTRRLSSLVPYNELFVFLLVKGAVLSVKSVVRPGVNHFFDANLISLLSLRYGICKGELLPPVDRNPPIAASQS